MIQIKEISRFLESLAPLSLQESYDNAGLQVGDPGRKIKSALLSIDVTEDVIEEAVAKGAGLIIAHHPLIFGPVKRLTGSTYVERSLISAVKNEVAVYAAHTNLDVVWEGVNRKICDKLGLKNIRVLQPVKEQLRKLVFFVPVDQADQVREAIFEAGAGHIGEYDRCSFNAEGTGTFRGSEDSDPFVGEKGKLHFESELRVETIYPAHAEKKVLDALISAHPYEEVAYDVYPLMNEDPRTGLGMAGELDGAEEAKEFLARVKKIFNAGAIRHSPFTGKKIRKVAVCGGSGAGLISRAIASGSDIYLTGDIKYHQYFEAEGKIILADIGHYESEQFTTEIFYDLLTKKFPNFAVYFSEVNTNPVNYS